jgi:DNA-binding LacI/PurR family transcriptional regulator
LKGYKDALGLTSKVVSTIAFGTYQYRSGFDRVVELFSGRDPPDALFCAGDLIACGAIDALRKKGLRVPEDVMVAGFDDIPQASWDSYSLTTLRQSVDHIVDRSIEMFHKQLRGKLKRGARAIVPVELIERGSTAPHAKTFKPRDPVRARPKP